MKVVRIKDLDVNKITFSDDIKRDTKGNRIYMKYEGQPFTVELPMMYMPFGASDYEDNGKFVINFSFSNMDSKPVIKMMHDKFMALDELIFEAVVKNCASWLAQGKKSREYIEDIYKNRLVKPNKNPDKYPPSFVAKLPRNEKTGEFYVTIQGPGGPDDIIKVNVDDDTPAVAIKQAIPKGSRGKALINMSSIWCGSTSVSVSRNVTLIQVFKNDRNTSAHRFSNSDDEEDTVETEETHQEDSDKEFLDEEEKEVQSDSSDGDEADTPPQQSPPPAKKAGKRGKRAGGTSGLKEALGAL